MFCAHCMQAWCWRGAARNLRAKPNAAFERPPLPCISFAVGISSILNCVSCPEFLCFDSALTRKKAQLRIVWISIIPKCGNSERAMGLGQSGASPVTKKTEGFAWFYQPSILVLKIVRALYLSTEASWDPAM